LLGLPRAADDPLPDIDRVHAQKGFERDRVRRRLLQNLWRHRDQWRTAFRHKRWRQFRSTALDDVERAAMRIENAPRAFDDQPVQICCANRLGKRGAETVQKIKDQRLLDLDLFFRTLQRADAADLEEKRRRPSDQASNKQPEEERSPHESEPTLLRGRLLMQVLF
jgi:hypothetical protein